MGGACMDRTTAIIQVAELLALQAGYAEWLSALPEGLSDSRTAAALKATSTWISPTSPLASHPRGYGRD